jgi:hypothetical protein
MTHQLLLGTELFFFARLYMYFATKKMSEEGLNIKSDFTLKKQGRQSGRNSKWAAASYRYHLAAEYFRYSDEQQ